MPRKLTKPRGKWAQWVRTVRGEISQERFAESIKMSRGSVTDWERGDTEPDRAALEKILKAFPSAAPPPTVVSIAVSDPAGKVAPVTKSRLGEALDAELARRNAAAHANALEMVLKMEKLGQPLSDEQLRAVAASLLDDVPADAGRGSRK